MRHNSIKSVISGKGVTMGETPVYVGTDHCARPPRVSVTRQEGEISSIRIECGCGEVIVLDCGYEQLAGAASSPPT